VLEAFKERQKRILELFTVVGIPFISLFGILNLLYDKQLLGILELFLAVVGIINIIVYKKTSNYNIASRVILIIIIGLSLITVITGGYKNQGIFWIYVIPPLTYFLREKSSALKWNIFFVLAVLISYVASRFGLIKFAYSFETIFIALCAYLGVTFLAYFYSHFLMELLESLKEKAIFDPLTKVYNRSFVLTYLEQELEKIKREKEKEMCLIFIDLDDFKKINDTYGHVKGDEILSEVSKIFKNNFRSSDIFGRFGGDEFILIVNTGNKEAIEEKLKFIKNQIEKIFKEYNLSLSYGIVVIPKETVNLEEALKMADERMYKMKESKAPLKMAMVCY